MAFTTWMSPPTNGVAGSADIRLWIGPLRQAFLNVGFVKTADTGQVDLTTVVNGTTGANFVGYDIFAFFGPLQSTHPLFLKLEYGSAGAVGRPTIAYTLGKGTDGAGNITGVLKSRVTSGPTNTDNPVALPSYLYADTGGFYLQLWPNHTSYAPALLVERARTASGEPRGDALVFGYCASNAETWYTISYASPSTYVLWSDSNTGTIWGFPSQVSGVGPNSTNFTLQVDANTALILPLRLFVPGVQPWVSNIIISGSAYDVAPLGLFSVRLNGAERTFRSFVFNSSVRGLCYSVIPPMRWE